MSTARCLSISRDKTHLQAGADAFSCWEFNHTDVAFEASLTFKLSRILFFTVCLIRLFFLLMNSIGPGRHETAARLPMSYCPQKQERRRVSAGRPPHPPSPLPLRQRRPRISGQQLMMQRRYCAFAAEQKSQRRGFWARAALEQRRPHSPALPPLGPLARRDELKPRAGSGNVMY